MEKLFVKCNSHRARKRLLAKIGARAAYFFNSFKRPRSKGIYAVTVEEYELVKDIPGISKTRDDGTLLGCL